MTSQTQAPWLATTQTPPASTETGATTGDITGEGTTPQADPQEAPVAPVSTTVTVTVPKPFILRLDSHVEKRFAAGVQEMEREHAEHWYAKANGVVIYQK